MAKLNQEIQTGQTRRTPLLIAIGVCLIVALLVTLTSYLKSHKSHDEELFTANIEPGEYGQKMIKYLKDEVQTKTTTESASHNFSIMPAILKEPTSNEALSFPQSYQQYLQIAANNDKADPNVKQAIAPQNLAQSQSERFMQDMQQLRYSKLLEALESPVSVNNAHLSKVKDTIAATQATPTPYAKTQLTSLQQGANLAQSQVPPYQNTAFAKTPQGNFTQNQAWSLGQNPANLGTGITSQQTLQAYQGLVNPHTTLQTAVEPVLSPFLLRQGAVLPCVLLTGVNSDLPGMIQAQVTQDVFDSPQGQHLLIPKGSRIIGQYASSPKLGQQRLMLAFNRIIFPNGAAMGLGAMPGSSLDGYAGFDADVDTHFWQLMSNAILLGGITAGISISVDEPRTEDGDLTLNGALSQGLGQSIGRVLTQVIERNLVVSPTLKVQPGLEFNVTLTQDIYFERPYQA